mmetsp:Transcript_76313/g.205045  ORF Transcript_76313/g.205045 Transcript_76313/m.205045 type:complete len:217 (-) Transcript_76313:632-1282(-)
MRPVHLDAPFPRRSNPANGRLSRLRQAQTRGASFRGAGRGRASGRRACAAHMVYERGGREGPTRGESAAQREWRAGRPSGTGHGFDAGVGRANRGGLRDDKQRARAGGLRGCRRGVGDARGALPLVGEESAGGRGVGPTQGIQGCPGPRRPRARNTADTSRRGCISGGSDDGVETGLENCTERERRQDCSDCERIGGNVVVWGRRGKAVHNLSDLT